MIRKYLMLGLTALVLAGSPLGAQADDRRPPPPRGVVTLPDAVRQQRRDAPQGQRVQVSMMVVHAHESHNRVDPRVNNLLPYLAHMRYTGFDLLNSYSVQMTQGRNQTFQIEGGREVTITLLNRDERRVKMRVQMTAGRGHKLLDTTLHVNRNGTFFVAGVKYKDGILVLPLTARY